jgi:hypothetical protein
MSAIGSRLKKSHLKHRWSIGNNYLGGITFPKWWRLLSENDFQVDGVYAHRAAFITAMSLSNAVAGASERLRYSKAVRNHTIGRPPVFILGHWRSGTTHLHNLLAQDVNQFTFPNTFQVVNPETFLTTEAVSSRLFASLVPKKRPMDNVSMSFKTPQEDEFAPAMLSLRSPYYSVTFPRADGFYNRFLTFRDADPVDRQAWIDGFQWFLKKVSFRDKGQRALLLKSPPHTARVNLLLEMFPDAKFVHIHRHPHKVFRSFAHYHDTMAWYTFLQKPVVADLEGSMIERYRELYNTFLDNRPLIPSGQFHEVRFDELERKPLRCLHETYESLGLTGFEEARPRFEAYIESQRNYEKNCFTDLQPRLKERLARSWGRFFEAFGYDSK